MTEREQLVKDFTELLIDAIQGTCKTEGEELIAWCMQFGTDEERARFGELTWDEDVDLALFDERTKLCTICEWWGYEGETHNVINDEQCCDDCYSDEGGDD